MRLFTLLCSFCCLAALCAADGASEKDAAIRRYLELTQAATGFQEGAEAGFDVGFDPATNPHLAAIPEEQLTAIRQQVGDLIAERFTYATIEEDMMSVIDGRYSLEELQELNGLLASEPVLQKMIQVNIDTIPLMMRISMEHMRELQPEIMAITQRIMNVP